MISCHVQMLSTPQQTDKLRSVWHFVMFINRETGPTILSERQESCPRVTRSEEWLLCFWGTKFDMSIWIITSKYFLSLLFLTSYSHLCHSFCEVPTEERHTCLVTKSCPTFETPWIVASQAPLSMGFSRQEYWSGLPLPSPGDLSDPGISWISHIAGRFFTIWAIREACTVGGNVNWHSHYGEQYGGSFKN